MDGQARRAQALPPPADIGTLCLLPGGSCDRHGPTFGPPPWGSLPEPLQTEPKPLPPCLIKPRAWLPASSQFHAMTQGLLLTPHLSRGHVWLGLSGHFRPVMPGRALEAARLEVKSCGEVQVVVTSGETAQSVDNGVIIPAGC